MKKIRKAALYSAAALGAYVLTVFGPIEMIADYKRSHTNPIEVTGNFEKDTSALQRVIDSEKKKMGLENEKIRGYVEFEKPLPNKPHTHAAASTGTYSSRDGKDKGLVVFIHGKEYMREGTVRHELRHIKNGDLKSNADLNIAGWLSYIFYKEPRVALQDIFSE